MSQLAAVSTCLHCGSAVSSSNAMYCCGGCEFVHSLLNEKGLGDYYRLRENRPVPITESQESFAYCDDPEFIQTLSGDGRTLDFYLEGVDCTACVWLLEKLPDICEDAEDARLRLGTSRLRVRRKENGSFAAIAKTLDHLGHHPHPVPTETAALRAQQAEDRRDLVRLGVAAFATGNIMLLAVSLYAGADGLWAERFRWLSGLLALPVLTFSAAPFYRHSWAALRQRRLNIDGPIVLAILVGAGVSLSGLLTGAETLYFDSLSMLVLLLLASRTWLKRLRRNHLDANDIDRQLLAGTVHKKIDGQWSPVSSLSLRAGDVISIEDTRFVPVDGLALEEGSVQNAALTGESTSERKLPGDLIEAGARVVSARLVMQATTDFGRSRLSKILREAESDSRAKPRWLTFSDRVAQVFILVVTALAAATFLYWMSTDPSEGARRALALIIVTCPCVFGMAIPLSLSLGIREAARNGVVVKNADLFERLALIRNVVFDKTGTLTEGDLRVTSAVGVDDTEAVLAVLSIEKDQTHPVARAIREYLGRPFSSARTERLRSCEGVTLLPEGGIQGSIEGKIWSLRPTEAEGDGDSLRSAIDVICEERTRMRLIVEDHLKAGAIEAVDDLRRRALKVHIFSGDHPSPVWRCARRLGLANPSECVRSSLRPEDKARLVRSLGDGSLMIGDGANDASALATATASIAVHGAMDVSLKIADAYVMGSRLQGLATLFEIARKTRVAIRRNLAFSLLFNLVAGSLAIAGHMTPLWAAVLMPLSSVTVLVSSLLASNVQNHHEEIH